MLTLLLLPLLTHGMCVRRLILLIITRLISRSRLIFAPLLSFFLSLSLTCFASLFIRKAPSLFRFLSVRSFPAPCSHTLSGVLAHASTVVRGLSE